MKLPVAILAGGLATRLRPLTEATPKALLDVAGKPFIIRQLDYLREQGVGRVALCTGFLGEQVASIVGDGSICGLSVSYSQDWPMLLGTGGALKQALPLLGSRFMVLYGDSFLPIDFASVERTFLESGKPAMMTVMHNAGRWDTSNVLFRDGEIVEYNKRAPIAEMRHIDYGLAALSADVLMDHGAEGAFDLADVYHGLSLSGRLAGMEVHERFYEIGSSKGLAEAADYFRGRGT
ncbi:NTP transferase domain-containing protein [Bradyrhizobium diazoefficiens]|nr:sugar phosphate nucleotidyltransferase [Bradyrhizobium diazoefficiens]MBR0849461.1 NTP transferase domain-containing protein [Bradyrhizobium diazoefficiens]